VTNGVMNGAMNPQGAVHSAGPRRRPCVMFAAVIWGCRSLRARYRTRTGPFRDRRSTQRLVRRDRPLKHRCGSNQGNALRRGRVPHLAGRRRAARGHLGVAQLHLLFAAFRPCRPNFRLHPRSDRLQRPEISDTHRLRVRVSPKLLSTSFSLTATFGRPLDLDDSLIMYPKFRTT